MSEMSRFYRELHGKRLIRSFLILILFVGGLVGVCLGFFLLILVGRDRSETYINRSIKSPDGSFKAVITTYAGGGAWSPYCIVSVSLSSALSPDLAAGSADKTIFSSACDGLDRKWRREWTDFVSWKSPTELQITFDPSEGSKGIDHLIQAVRSADGKVTINYTIINEIDRYRKWLSRQFNGQL